MKFDKDNDLLIIPDVHGRTFWREALEQKKYSHVIFLGDYVDPYPQEKIDNYEAFEILVEIVKYAKQHRDTCTLLLGNHDMHYMSPAFAKKARGSRFSFMMEDEFNCVFCENEDLFSLAFEADYEQWHCLITHAGVNRQWYEAHKDVIGELNAENLNKLHQSKDGIDALTDIGCLRGGFSKTGSMLWADFFEVAGDGDFPGIFQIFGHTQDYEHTVRIKGHAACVDCHRALLLSEVLEMAAKEQKKQ